MINWKLDNYSWNVSIVSSRLRTVQVPDNVVKHIFIHDMYFWFLYYHTDQAVVFERIEEAEYWTHWSVVFPSHNSPHYIVGKLSIQFHWCIFIGEIEIFTSHGEPTLNRTENRVSATKERLFHRLFHLIRLTYCTVHQLFRLELRNKIIYHVLWNWQI